MLIYGRRIPYNIGMYSPVPVVKPGKRVDITGIVCYFKEEKCSDGEGPVPGHIQRVHSSV